MSVLLYGCHGNMTSSWQQMYTPWQQLCMLWQQHSAAIIVAMATVYTPWQQLCTLWQQYCATIIITMATESARAIHLGCKIKGKALYSVFMVVIAYN